MTRKEQVLALLNFFSNESYSFDDSAEEIRHAIEMSDYLDQQLELPVGTVMRDLPEVEEEIEEDDQELDVTELPKMPKKHGWF